MNSGRVVPQPIYPLETFAEESDETVESPSSSGGTADTDATTDDSQNDVLMEDEGDTQQEELDMPVEDPNHTEHLEFIRATAQRLEISEEEQMKDDDSSEEDMDTYLYPDPELSEMIPPPTPRLPHADLPLSFIDSNEMNGVVNKAPEVPMDDSEEGDLSNTTHLMPAQRESPRFSWRMYSRAIKSGIDENAGSSPSTEMDISDTSTSELLHRMTPDPVHCQIPGLGLVRTDGAESTRCSMAELSDGTSSGQLSLSKSVDVQESTAMEEANHLQKHTPSTASNQRPSLELVAVHANMLTGSLSGSKRDTLAEQAPAAHSAKSTLGSTTVDREEVPDPVLDQFMEDVEEMEAAVLAKADAERRLLCRAHKMPASEHYTSWPPGLAARLRFGINNNARSIDRDRPQTIQELRELKNRRNREVLWSRHAVWERSLLCAETNLFSIRDPRGEYQTWIWFQPGRGPTGGDPCSQFWRSCNHCGESLNALWNHDRTDHSTWNQHEKY